MANVPPPLPGTPHAFILQRAEQDLDEGLDHVRKLLKEQGKGPLAFIARGLEMAVLGGLAALELRPRMREDVTFLMGLAERVNRGEDPARLVEENLPRALRLKELSLLAKVKDPAFAPVQAKAKEIFLARLPDLARMVAVSQPASYEDLVVRAFPEKEHVVRIVRENRDGLVWVVDHAERNPHLLRLPKNLVPRIAALAREVTDWQTARVLAAVDAMYAAKA